VPELAIRRLARQRSLRSARLSLWPARLSLWPARLSLHGSAWGAALTEPGPRRLASGLARRSWRLARRAGF
jgi:hypothetical protein